MTNQLKLLRKTEQTKETILVKLFSLKIKLMNRERERERERERQIDRQTDEKRRGKND
jgi:hypothetical protein